MREVLAQAPEWTAAAMHEIVNRTAETLGLKLGKIAQPLRVAVAGRAVSPPIDVTLALVGRERTLRRLDAAIDHIERQSAVA